MTLGDSTSGASIFNFSGLVTSFSVAFPLEDLATSGSAAVDFLALSLSVAVFLGNSTWSALFYAALPQTVSQLPDNAPLE